MRAAVLNRPGEVEVVQRPDPVPEADEVLVRVHAVGVCGSDTHYFDHGRIGRFVVALSISVTVMINAPASS